MLKSAKVGDIVKLIDGEHGENLANPIWGGKNGNTKGVIVRIEASDYCYYVKWDNGCSNQYKKQNLALVERVGPAHKLTTIFV